MLPRLFITIILFLGAVFTSLFYLGPEWKRFNDIRQEVSRWNSVGVELDELIQNRDLLIETINTISKQDLDRINASLPEGPHSSDFLVLLENLSSAHGLILKRLDLASFTQPATTGTESSQPKPSGVIIATPLADKTKEFPIHFNVNGSYKAFKDFLIDVERNLRLIDIQEISFSSTGKGDTIEFVVKAKTYYQ